MELVPIDLLPNVAMVSLAILSWSLALGMMAELTNWHSWHDRHKLSMICPYLATIHVISAWLLFSRFLGVLRDQVLPSLIRKLLWDNDSSISQYHLPILLFLL
jgi:hypothetical protein